MALNSSRRSAQSLGDRLPGKLACRSTATCCGMSSAAIAKERRRLSASCLQHRVAAVLGPNLGQVPKEASRECLPGADGPAVQISALPRLPRLQVRIVLSCHCCSKNRQRREDGDVQRASGDGETKPSFATRLNARAALSRCQAITNGRDTPGGKQPWYFTARDGSPLLTAAGLWDEWKNRETGERLKSCTMIITEPNDFAAEVHDRMPVFLKEEQFEPWLSGEAGAEF